jgi:uncharacterized DUF497 family protein
MSGLQFEWDPDKEAINIAKHGVSFSQAAEVFGDPRALTVFDDAHSADEDREITIGLAGIGPVLVVVHVDRDDRLRIISARKATPRERRAYDHG